MLERRRGDRSGSPGKYVDTYAFADGRLEVRWQGLSLPYKAFDKDQRVSHAAIVENKRLGEVLAFIKSQQDARPSAAAEDQQREDRLPEDRAETTGRKSFVDKMIERRRTSGRQVVAAARHPLHPLPQRRHACPGLLRLRLRRPRQLRHRHFCFAQPRTLQLGCNIV